MAKRTAEPGILEKLIDGVVRAVEGHGPLLERDYWAAIENCRVTPPELIDRVARDFPDFAPEALVRFTRPDGRGALEVGDEMDAFIRMSGECRVRVLHRDHASFTLGTLRGHPEAGRITFGAYRDSEGAVIFHIRSRARSSTRAKRIGFIAGGEPMQTATWTDFIDRVAHTMGDGVAGVIHAETREIEDEPNDPNTLCSPTFIAREDSISQTEEHP